MEEGKRYTFVMKNKFARLLWESIPKGIKGTWIEKMLIREYGLGKMDQFIPASESVKVYQAYQKHGEHIFQMGYTDQEVQQTKAPLPVVSPSVPEETVYRDTNKQVLRQKHTFLKPKQKEGQKTEEQKSKLSWMEDLYRRIEERSGLK